MIRLFRTILCTSQLNQLKQQINKKLNDKISFARHLQSAMRFITVHYCTLLILPGVIFN